MQLTLEFTKKDLEGRGLAPQGGASALGVCKVGWCPQLTRGEAAVLVERSLLGGRLRCLRKFRMKALPRGDLYFGFLPSSEGHLQGPSCPCWGRVRATSDRWCESWFSFQEGPAEEGGEHHPQSTIMVASLAQVGPTPLSADSSVGVLRR